MVYLHFHFHINMSLSFLNAKIIASWLEIFLLLLFNADTISLSLFHTESHLKDGLVGRQRNRASPGRLVCQKNSSGIDQTALHPWAALYS